MFVRLILAVTALCLSACAAVTSVPTTTSADRPLVVLMSIDGFHPDYLDRGLTPTLSRLAAEGVSGAMRPSFPTKTFPNHYTLVTGLRPDRHGVVNNTMEDPAIPGVTFRLSNAEAVTDARWWDDAEPIWVTAERAGIGTATLFWPGSEAAIHGVRPTLWAKYDGDLPDDARVDQLLTWLGGEGGRRIGFATVYSDIVDSAGHEFGPDSAEVNATLAAVDASTARLVAGLERLGRPVVLLIVSDHGMAATSPDRVVRLGPVVSDDSRARVIYQGATVGIEPLPGHEAAVAAEVLTPRDHVQCWARGTLPERLHFGAHRRAPSFFCLADTGWRALTQTARVGGGGDHGYDDQAPEMAALFIAHGAGVARGRRIEGLVNTDIHPLLGRLLGIAVPAGDGDPAATLPVTTP